MPCRRNQCFISCEYFRESCQEGRQTSTRKKLNRAKTSFSTKYIEQLVCHTMQSCKLQKSEISGLVPSHSNISNVTLLEARKNLMDMISSENYANSEQGCAFSNLEWSKTETIIPLLENAMKDTNYTETADLNIQKVEIINGSLNQISQKCTLNERQKYYIYNCRQLSSGLIEQIIV